MELSSRKVLLLVDDNAAFVAAMRRALQDEYDVLPAHTARDAMLRLSPPPDAVLLDVRLDENRPDDRQGVSLLQVLKQQLPDRPVLMITAHGDLDTAVECMRLGAADFIEKSRASVQEVKSRLAHALEHAQIYRRLTELERDIRIIEPRTMVGRSAAMETVRRGIRIVAEHDARTVLIRGETGTGKELVARAIHASGPRASGPFVPVVLSALPAQTIESELFGHEKGAFTDARARRIGYIEKAHGGVLFLDEIGEIGRDLQVKLLRVLEEREFQRLGSTSPVQVDVQVLAATNAELATRVQDGSFREDLYFRLTAHEIVVPPVRERPEDIPLLVEHFLSLLRQQGKGVHTVHPDALETLRGFPWPGNVRQLKNAMESAVFQAAIRAHEAISAEDLPTDVRLTALHQQTPVAGLRPLGEEGVNVSAELARVELAYADEGLRGSAGKVGEAWRLLGYNDRFTFARRVRRLIARHPDVASDFPGLIQRFGQEESAEG